MAAIGVLGPKGHLAEDDIWVITCLVVRAEYRGTGIATALLHEAVKHARKHGANTLRARPTDTTQIKKSSAALFTGILSTFDAAGFNHANQNRSRVLVELNLNQHSQTSNDS
ncbi:GNAT family N-acetyltransferase [Paeniglutamicibacter antarcticus]|uniref:GNAT family N-acetyltransferase n=1 Tax=Arthrobacter terrae TaxID=2935737 RepID=A0A931CXJ8_9MICC|nr:GNAT family N-acetyltransferase [Arthrobacter terrae]MBG0741803.1 GNAT family N-acetyltransferase [Arthrobacter terrae]